MYIRRARIVLVLLAYAHTTCALVDDVLDVLRLGKEIGEEVLSSWDIIGKSFNASEGVELPVIRRKEKIILAKLAQVTRSIERLEVSVDKTTAVAIFLAKNKGRNTRLELKLHELATLLASVAAADRQMREYVGYQDVLERSTLEDFAEWSVSHDPYSLPGLMERIHSLIVPPHKNLLGQSLLQLLVESLKVCNHVHSSGLNFAAFLMLKSNTNPRYM